MTHRRGGVKLIAMTNWLPVAMIAAVMGAFAFSPANAVEAAPEAKSATAPAVPAAALPAAPLDQLYARLARTRYPEEAEGILAEIERLRMKSGSDSADLLLGRALKARESAKLDIALPLFDAVVELYPDWSEAWSERATTRFQNGDVNGAMGDLAQTLKREPRDVGGARRPRRDPHRRRRAGRGAARLRPRARACPRVGAAQGGAGARAELGLEPLALMTFALGALGGLAALSLSFTLAMNRILAAALPGGRPSRRPRPRQAACRRDAAARAGARGGAAHAWRLRQFRRSRMSRWPSGWRQEGYRVFAVDRPGHGYSDRLGGRGATSPSRQAAWIREALATLGVREAIVVVHSLAGVLGLAMAVDAPEFTRGLVLLAPVSHPWPGGVSWYYTLAAPPLPRRAVSLAARAAVRAREDGQRAARRPSRPTRSRPTTRAARGWRCCSGPGTFAPIPRTSSTCTRRSRRCRRVTARSPRRPHPDGRRGQARVRRIARPRLRPRIFPTRRLRMLPGVGHSPHFAAPEEVVAAIAAVDRQALGKQTPLRSTAAAG